MNDLLKNVLILLAVAIGGAGLGYWMVPTKIKIEEKIVEKIIHERDEKTTKEYDPITGKVIKETTETKDKETSSTKTDKTVEKEQAKKVYAVKAGAVINPRDLSGKLIPRAGMEIRLPFFNSWAGLEADINIDRPLVGGYLRLEF